MSNPNINNITPTISLSTGQTVPLLLASIALEELALAHLINAEAEGLQFILGTLTPTHTAFTPANVSLSNFLDANTSVQRTLRDAIMKEQLLEFKFENVLDLLQIPPTPPTPSFTCNCSATMNFAHTRVIGTDTFTDILTGTICPSCGPTGSGFTHTRIETGNFPSTVIFRSDTITSVTCFGTSGNFRRMEVTGTGTGFVAGGVPFPSNFSLLLEDFPLQDQFTLVYNDQFGNPFTLNDTSTVPGAINLTACP